MKFLFSVFLIMANCAPLQLPATVNSDPAAPSVVLPWKLKWEINHSERIPWSTEILKQFKNNLSTFNAASDISVYCPKWKSLDDDHKVFVLGTMGVAIALYESAYNPGTVFHEPPPLGIDSIGLFQLSYEDKMSWCSMVKAKNTLKDPIVNIQCAIPKMAALVKQNGVISAQVSGSWKGLPRYWSTMRPKGKLAQVKAATTSLEFCK